VGTGLCFHRSCLKAELRTGVGFFPYFRSSEYVSALSAVKKTSSASEDIFTAKKLFTQLKHAGFRPWLKAESLLPSESLRFGTIAPWHCCQQEICLHLPHHYGILNRLENSPGLGTQLPTECQFCVFGEKTPEDFFLFKFANAHKLSPNKRSVVSQAE